MNYSEELTNYLELPYTDIAVRNAAARAIRDPQKAQATHTKYLLSEPRLKAVTVCFSDIEGRLHMLDYNKQFFIDSIDNLTFDGSSIKGMSQQKESDLRLGVDWTSFTMLPADIFGAGKVLVFANVHTRSGAPYETDFRGQLQQYLDKLDKNGLRVNMAPEVEGFLLDGVEAEQRFDEETGFSLVSTGGYFHSLPFDKLRQFIDKTAEVLGALGYHNEKDHPEVAPSQFELNFRYTDALRACDQVQLYKLICRQIAMTMGMTATFLPKPIANINGSGMHVNLSVERSNKNIFYDQKGTDGLSKDAWGFVDRVLNRAPELCLLLNSSVNAYRRLDPHFEAPNQIKVSANDRGSMIRIPAGNEKTARIEVRSVSPDANPYLALFGLVKTGLDDETPEVDETKRPRLRYLPGTLHDAMRIYKASDYMTSLLGESAKQKYYATKQAVADRSGSELGTRVKLAEVVYHHEVTNQYLWSQF